MKTRKHEGWFHRSQDQTYEASRTAAEGGRALRRPPDPTSKAQEVHKREVARGSERDRPPSETEGREDRRDRRTRASALTWPRNQRGR